MSCRSEAEKGNNMKKKYTIKDFFAGKCSILCNTKEEYDKMIELCEKKGIIWNAREKPKDYNAWERHAKKEIILMINFYNNGRMTYATPKEWEAFEHVKKRYKLLNFADVSPIIRQAYELHFTSNDGITTHAVFKVNGKVVKRSVAKCSPLDRFNFFIGVQTAFDRLKESKKA